MEDISSKLHDDIIYEILMMRTEVENDLSVLPNVVGTMAGVKIKSNEILSEKCLTVLVSEKVNIDELGTQNIIPRTFTRNDIVITTDVIVVAPLAIQKATGNRPDVFNKEIIVSDGSSYGTMTSLCRSEYGIYGMSCAHVLWGKDKNPATSDVVEGWSTIGRYIPIGKTVYATVGPGAGSPDDFGFSDAILFSIESPELQQRGRQARVVTCARPILGEPLVAHTAINGTISANIIGINAKQQNTLIDVCLRVNPPGTFLGDSGVLWMDQHNSPVAIHTFGEHKPPQEGSFLTGAMLASRAAKMLSVQILSET